MTIVRKEIIKQYLLLCEGRDAEYFLINFLESKALSADKRFSNEIQVMDFGGNGNLDDFLINIKNMDRYDQVKSIAIIRDAEQSFNNAHRDVIRALRHSNLAIPDHCGVWVNDDAGLNIGYIFFPLNNEYGTLEDLCLQILSENQNDAILTSVDSFLAMMESDYGRHYSKKHKNRLHTYLSSSNEYVTMPLGLASSAGAFNWASNYLEPLKIFLADGFKKTTTSFII